MIIQEEDFRMTSCGEANYFFDLEILQTIRPKGGEERREFKNVGYGMTLKKCIQCIINNRIENKQSTLTLTEYLRLYEEQLTKLETLIRKPNVSSLPVSESKEV